MSNVSNLLKANKSEAGKPGSSVPVLKADALYDSMFTAYTHFKDAEASYRALEAELLQRTDEMYAENAQNGTFSKSFNLPGLQTPGVQVSYKDQFTAIPVENEENLKSLLGDKYSQYFDEKRELQLVDTSDDAINQLIAALGEDKFLKMFSIKLTISAKKDMDRRQFDMNTNARAFLKQYKASVKLGK